jgi:hypothetical protein
VRDYIDLVAPLVESILAELEQVSLPDNTSKEIGAAGKHIDNHMTDMLPHHGVFDRNKPQAFAEIFASVCGKTYETGFERETPPSSDKLKKWRNNDASAKKLNRVPDKGDPSSILHSDFADASRNDRSVLPGKRMGKL